MLINIYKKSFKKCASNQEKFFEKCANNQEKSFEKCAKFYKSSLIFVKIDDILYKNISLGEWLYVYKQNGRIKEMERIIK